ncbi:type II toxin-antitoxin system CcdA family antitoxin [Sphingomonas sp. ID0503]|uniref:type II toxin-antitoxin system CcdA family antitoxin n=1 Tax=Sphingomonas sp. ID0503 TaxID=3399691 RepID=UPI003AFB66B2
MYAENMRMRHDSISSGQRKPVNLSIDTGVISAAREAGLNLSRLCEEALRAESRKVLERRWQEENAAAIDAWNDWLEENGLPLSDLDPL